MTSAAPMELARVEPAGLAMVLTPTEAEERLKQLQEFIARNMVEGEDYGMLPGTKTKDGERPKKILLQPGAQKLAEIYGLSIEFGDERPPIERWDGDPMFAYFKKATVRRRSDGLLLGSGIGSCNSREKKYASRWVFAREVPPELNCEHLPSREGIGRNNKPYVMYKVPNLEIFDLVNTFEKMACKRALVHAVIAVTRSSGLFTQDMEPARAAASPHEVTDAEWEEEPIPERRHPTANELAATARSGSREDVEGVLAFISGLPTPSPKIAAISYQRLSEMAGDLEEVEAIRRRAELAALPAEIHGKLIVRLDARCAELRETAPAERQPGED